MGRGRSNPVLLVKICRASPFGLGSRIAEMEGPASLALSPHPSCMASSTPSRTVISPTGNAERRGLSWYLLTNSDGERNDMEIIWRYILEKEFHQIDVKETPVFLSCGPLSSKADREKMTELMFERFEAESVLVAASAKMALFGTGRPTGLVVDCGHSFSNIVPVYDGFVIPHAVMRCHVAGHAVTMRLMALLQERGFLLDTTASDLEVARHIKETRCCSSEESLSSLSVDERYALPDGRSMLIGSERLQCVEPLFQLSGSTHCLQEAALICVQKCDIDIRAQLVSDDRQHISSKSVQ
jgi:hypothetical protein